MIKLPVLQHILVICGCCRQRPTEKTKLLHCKIQSMKIIKQEKTKLASVSYKTTFFLLKVPHVLIFV